MNNFGKGKKTRLSRVYFVWTIRDFGSAECESKFQFQFQHGGNVTVLIARVPFTLTSYRGGRYRGQDRDTYLPNGQDRVCLSPSPSVGRAVCLCSRDSEDKMNNILVNDVGAEQDAITSLRAPTHFGRPNVCPHLFLTLSHMSPYHSSLSLPGVFGTRHRVRRGLSPVWWTLIIQWDRVFESIADKHPDTNCGVFFCGPAVLATELQRMSNKYTSPMGCRFFFGKEVSWLSFNGLQPG